MKTLSIIAIAGLAATAGAQNLLSTGAYGHSASNQTGATATSTFTYTFDQSHFGLIGDPLNFIDSLDLNAILGGVSGEDAFVTGIGWDVTVEAFDPSWLSEAGYSFNGEVNLSPGAGDDFAGVASYSSGGIIDISDAVGFDILAAGGILNIEFFDGFDDDIDPNSVSFGTLDIQVSYKVPAPAGLAVLGLGGLVAARRRR
jgi:hypothetical protein